ncbi:aspartate aminotransferase family protein [Sesbania bispinosa]|nr:aspartate aminotransferase family protein [Sesbania bispinosa]
MMAGSRRHWKRSLEDGTDLNIGGDGKADSYYFIVDVDLAWNGSLGEISSRHLHRHFLSTTAYGDGACLVMARPVGGNGRNHGQSSLHAQKDTLFTEGKSLQSFSVVVSLNWKKLGRK